MDKEEAWREAAKMAVKDDPSSVFVGSACPKCWKPISLDYRVDSTVCECGNTTSKEEVLAAHGLSGLTTWLKAGPGIPRASKMRSDQSDG